MAESSETTTRPHVRIYNEIEEESSDYISDEELPTIEPVDSSGGVENVQENAGTEGHGGSDEELEGHLADYIGPSTPYTFYGQYIKPTQPIRNPVTSTLDGKFIAMSYIFPNTNLYTRYLDFTLNKFLYDSFENQELKAYNILAPNIEAIHLFNERFKEYTAKQFVESYNTYRKARAQELLGIFYEKLPGVADLMTNERVKVNNLATHLMRPLGIFDTQESAENYIQTHYDRNYPFQIYLTECGKWTPIFLKGRSPEALKSYDEDHERTIEILRNFHEEQIKSDEEFKKRQLGLSNVYELDTIRIKRLKKKYRNKARETIANGLINDILVQLGRISDSKLRKYVVNAIHEKITLKTAIEARHVHVAPSVRNDAEGHPVAPDYITSSGQGAFIADAVNIEDIQTTQFED